jgi:hypothetical protein
MSAAARLLVLVPALAAAGCVSFAWERESSYLEPRPEAVGQVAAGRSTLGDCLAHLGAPLHVQEHGDGAVAYWGWTRQRRFGVSVDVPLSKQLSGSVSYADADRTQSGLLVVFDAGWNVELVQYGRLADLLGRIARRRSQLVPDEADPPQ